jgi:hypothetical protein
MGISHFQVFITANAKNKTPKQNQNTLSHVQSCIQKEQTTPLLTTMTKMCFPKTPDNPKTKNPQESLCTSFQCFSSCTSLQYLTNAFLCTSPTNLPSLNTQMYRSPNFTKHSYTRSMGEQISSDTGAASM